MPDRTFLADLVLAVHFVFVLFVVGGLCATWLGARWRWRFARNFAFRVTHLCATWFVAIETLLGYACPLTVLEDLLRSESSAGDGFLQRWISRLLYWDFPVWVFAVAYLLFALAVTATYWRIPPMPKSGSPRAQVPPR
ncbi:MAG: DUF2784 domain-containing protein [Burkholderiales bacterium]